jgi:hypothetical protein
MGLFSSKKTIPATGFYTMPKEYQDVYRGMLNQLGNTLLPNGQLNTEMFTPLPMTGDEERAIGMIRKGLAPTEESLRSDVSMLMNPFDEYVIDDLNRQAQAENSILNQAMSQVGQMGSNRGILGASDIEQQRLGQIGRFRQGQYNNAVNTALGTLTGLRQQDIGNLMGVGTFERGLDTQTRQAPLAALNALQGGLNQVQTSGWNFGAPEQTVKSGGGLGGMLGSIGSIAGGAIGGPVGAAIGGAVGGGFGGGNGFNLGGALQGGLSGVGGIQGLMSSTAYALNNMGMGNMAYDLLDGGSARFFR